MAETAKTVTPEALPVQKKYAKFSTNPDGLLVKTMGYCLPETTTPPAGAVAITDEQETLLNNNYYVKDLTTMELAPIPEHVNTLDENKAIKTTQAGASFAKKRGAIRWITISTGRYGFDCANEDITNFMAASKAADLDGSTPYKVWETDTTKGLITLTSADCTIVFKAVRDDQLKDYSWYETTKAAIAACTTQAELDAIIID